jgi:hypothetical protein
MITQRTFLGSGIGVRQHPQGGYTLAVPVAGADTARVYVGRWPTLGQAARYAVTTPLEQLEALAAALVARGRTLPC